MKRTVLNDNLEVYLSYIYFPLFTKKQTYVLHSECNPVLHILTIHFYVPLKTYGDLTGHADKLKLYKTCGVVDLRSSDVVPPLLLNFDK